jgi:hypothetical protein
MDHHDDDDSASSYSYSSAPTPSGYTSRSSLAPSPRDSHAAPAALASGSIVAAPIRLLSSSAHTLLCAADDAFAWLADARGDPPPAVHPPPRPESLTDAGRRHRRRQRMLQWTAAPSGGDASSPASRASHAPKIEWKEIGELHSALSENDQALRRLSTDLASRDADAQALMGQREAALAERRATLRALRERVDAAPGRRAAKLEALHKQVHAAAAAVDAARQAVSRGHEQAADEDRVAWEDAEERAAAFAAECARETASAEATEAEGIALLGKLAERLAGAEVALEQGHLGLRA